MLPGIRKLPSIGKGAGNGLNRLGTISQRRMSSEVEGVKADGEVKNQPAKSGWGRTSSVVQRRKLKQRTAQNSAADAEYELLFGADRRKRELKGKMHAVWGIFRLVCMCARNLRRIRVRKAAEEAARLKAEEERRLAEEEAARKARLAARKPYIADFSGLLGRVFEFLEEKQGLPPEQQAELELAAINMQILLGTIDMSALGSVMGELSKLKNCEDKMAKFIKMVMESVVDDRFKAGVLDGVRNQGLCSLEECDRLEAALTAQIAEEAALKAEAAMAAEVAEAERVAAEAQAAAAAALAEAEALAEEGGGEGEGKSPEAAEKMAEAVRAAEAAREAQVHAEEERAHAQEERVRRESQAAERAHRQSMAEAEAIRVRRQSMAEEERERERRQSIAEEEAWRAQEERRLSHGEEEQEQAHHRAAAAAAREERRRSRQQQQQEQEEDRAREERRRSRHKEGDGVPHHPPLSPVPPTRPSPSGGRPSPPSQRWLRRPNATHPPDAATAPPSGSDDVDDFPLAEPISLPPIGAPPRPDMTQKGSGPHAAGSKSAREARRATMPEVGPDGKLAHPRAPRGEPHPARHDHDARHPGDLRSSVGAVPLTAREAAAWAGRQEHRRPGTSAAAAAAPALWPPPEADWGSSPADRGRARGAWEYVKGVDYDAAHARKPQGPGVGAFGEKVGGWAPKVGHGFDVSTPRLTPGQVVLTARSEAGHHGHHHHGHHHHGHAGHKKRHHVHHIGGF